jgi:hypothetical protein
MKRRKNKTANRSSLLEPPRAGDAVVANLPRAAQMRRIPGA